MDQMSHRLAVAPTGDRWADRPRLRASAPEREADERFRALVHNSFDAIVVSDHENVITFASPAIQSLFGYTTDELIGLSGFSFVHPEDRAASIESARSLLARAGSASLQTFRLRHADGTYRWVECTSVNLLDHQQVSGILNTFRDITVRKEAEDRVRDNEERLQALLMNADGAILVVDPRGTVTWASPSAELLWGLPSDSLLGDSVTQLIHPDDRREVIRQFSKLAGARPESTLRLEARMRHGDGSWRWYESIFTNRIDAPAVNGIVANVRDTTERVLGEHALRESERQLEHQANHDPLTGLPNRTLLLDRIEMALARSSRNGSSMAVLFCDVDHFKVVNDSQGHSQGDVLLVAVAQRLVAAIRPGDTIARFGGDEFIVLCEDLRDGHEASIIAQRIAAELAAPFTLADAEVFVTISIGISHASDGSPDAEALIRNADAAMYQAKARGRGRAEVFDDDMRARAVERHQIETSLRRAVARRQLQVHYQPIVDLRTDRVTGFEALVRWKHPSRGILYPATFMAIAEDTGLIVPLGAWIFDQACAQAGRWQDRQRDDLSIAINLSACQLADPSLIDDISSVLAATRIDPGHVHVEITESVLMHDVDASMEVLDRLKVLGVRVAIDDFGTGYSSFSYLRRFPVDILKIDQSYIQAIGVDGDADAIVESLINLGHTLGLDVVAEGVETEAQLAALRALGCDFAQGFFIARALPPAVVGERLDAGTFWPPAP
jgi:diguanylate cyclase (GGDEF)-like protein/PAS domain S-box-containing protein